ncbi:MAG: tetratricopeptide repeat protein [Acidobacteria bacterium]|nr:tetratricopeptide repeat protein [Acidobacteriota bacterium]
MSDSITSSAARVLRFAALANFGCVGGGFLLAAGAAGAKVLAEVTGTDWGKAGADVLTELVSQALQHLQPEAVQLNEEFGQWFEAWNALLAARRPEEVFRGTGDADPTLLQLDEAPFREHWWSQMEPKLVRWRYDAADPLQRLNLDTPRRLPLELSDFLRLRLPQALRDSHDTVLREQQMTGSWIAFQQHVLRDVANQLHHIRQTTDETLAILKGKRAIEKVWEFPRPTQHFRTRPHLLKKIEAALAQGETTALTAMHGLPGIGKSQLARYYAESYQARYRCGAWINAETPLAILGSFERLGRLLGVPIEKDPADTVAGVRNALHNLQPWLLVFDNAESPQLVRDHLQWIHGGHVLITSRSSHWDGLARQVEVSKWNQDEAVSYLLERTGQSDPAAARALARDLDGLVLSLEHAADYMAAGHVPLADYHAIWKEKLSRVPKRHDYPDSVSAAISLSLDRVLKQSEAAYHLLCLLAWLSPDPIPYKELLLAGRAKLPPSLATAMSDRDAWMEVEDVLSEYALLRRDEPRSGETVYELHRVVREVIRSRLNEQGEAVKWFTAACDLVDESFPRDAHEPQSWQLAQQLLPHAAEIKSRVVPETAPSSAGRLLNHAGNYLKSRGLPADASSFLKLALDADLRLFGPDHADVAVSRSNLANILRALGEHAEARNQIELALDADLRLFGPDHPTVAIDRSNLANILRDLGEHAEARKQIQLALDADLRLFGPDHPNVAIDRSNLAAILRNLGEHAEARRQIELALDADLRLFGPDHPNVAIHRSSLANIFGDLGEHAEARRQIELALDAALRRFGPDHPNVATYRSNLAAILRDLGEHGEPSE